MEEKWRANKNASKSHFDVFQYTSEAFKHSIYLDWTVDVFQSSEHLELDFLLVFVLKSRKTNFRIFALVFNVTKLTISIAELHFSLQNDAFVICGAHIFDSLLSVIYSLLVVHWHQLQGKQFDFPECKSHMHKLNAFLFILFFFQFNLFSSF